MFRSTRLLRGASVTAVGFLGLYQCDKQFNCSAVWRNVKTLYTALHVTIDYKWNFVPEKSEQISDLHRRTAQRIFKLCKDNGGIYIKFGQQLATIPVLPPEYVTLFRQLYDQAPSHTFDVVEQIVRRELKAEVSDIFSSFSETPLASASIAQVHQAVLKNGTSVAVKIQKPELQAQINLDLMIHRCILI
jgi:aarF domain-containing kinase